MATKTNFFENPYEDIFEKSKEISRKLEKGLKTAELISERLSQFDNKVWFNNIESTERVLKNIDNIFSSLASDKMQIISTLERVCDPGERLFSALQASENLIKILDADFDKFFEKLSINEAFEHVTNLQAILPKVVEKADEEIKKETLVETEEKTHQKTKKVTINKVKIYLELLNVILSIIFNLYSFVFSTIPEINIDITNDHSTNYYIQEVNNYYTKSEEFCTKEYNENGYRFVAEKEIIVRIKPDCSSCVVEKLKLGKVVQIVDKKKKWVQIRWSNKDDTYSYGWIQNYKLAEFEE